MDLGSRGHRKLKSNDCCTLLEFMSSMLQEVIPAGNYQDQLCTMIGLDGIGEQDNLTLGMLPSITCSALGGDPIKSDPVTAAWQFIRLAAKLFDDVEDGEIGDRSAVVNNLATGCLLIAHAALEKLTEHGISCEVSQWVRKEFNQACLQACAGQHVDLSTRWDRFVPSPDGWLEVAQAKSGVLFAWASWAGAVVADVSEEVQTGFWEFGLHLGILIQIADDFNGIWSSFDKTDLSSLRVNLPICYAYFVADEIERDDLLKILNNVNKGNRQSISKGQDLLSDLGSQKLMLAAAQVQRYQALNTISRINLSTPERHRLSNLLDNTFPALVHLTIPCHEIISTNKPNPFYTE
jgi:geranylgeranyl pyrophosphate synthase